MKSQAKNAKQFASSEGLVRFLARHWLEAARKVLHVRMA